jgi:NADH-quinone oxidoreductase subunit J
MDPLLAATVPDIITFAVAAVVVLVGALGVVFSRNPVHAALMLVMTLFGIAVLFVQQQADFLAAVQVIVYAGAIVVLFLFVIMLLGVDKREAVEVEPLKGQRPAALALALVALLEIILLLRTEWTTGASSVAGAASGPGANVEKIARLLFTRYVLAFELTGLLLVVAIVGAVVLSRRADRPIGSGEGAEQSTEGATS